ncbi:MAG: PIN domain nuclease, partial [Nitrososphaerota archaeon]|nr:PIN domain nuclease [Nitrososphaerota archaeon]
SKLREAEEAMSKIDPTDVPLVTAALSARCDGIWSDDKDLKRQDKVRVWTTKEVASLSRT